MRAQHTKCCGTHVRPEIASWKALKANVLKAEKYTSSLLLKNLVLSRPWSGTRPPLIFISCHPYLNCKEGLSFSAQSETSLKITFFLGVTGRFFCSGGNWSGRRGFRSGSFWGDLRRSIALSSSCGRELQRRLRLLCHLAPREVRAEVVAPRASWAGFELVRVARKAPE